MASTTRCSPTTSIAPTTWPVDCAPGTVGHNSFRTDLGITFGGFKQSGLGREGGRDGLLPFLEAKRISTGNGGHPVYLDPEVPGGGRSAHGNGFASGKRGADRLQIAGKEA
jgi:hypothetical protein